MTDPLLTPKKIRKDNPYPDLIRGNRTFGEARLWEDGAEYAQEYYEAQLLKLKARPDKEKIAEGVARMMHAPPCNKYGEVCGHYDV
ncbi:hypothetical protein LCGC14_1498360, partial [marine sediment metagenome]